MKTSLRILTVLAAITGLATLPAKAQYYEMANQLTNMLQPALSGSFNYKGFVDATATFGVGTNRANFIGVSTTQGFQYASWFYMGVGMGVDVAMASGVGEIPPASNYPDYIHSSSTTRAMIPIFSDFRFNIGKSSGTSFFIDIKAGATWIIGSSYLQLAQTRLTGQTQFILRPSIGLRIPTNSKNPKQALNVGFTYQLITANNSWGYWNSTYDTTLNSLGLNVSYEW